MTIDKWFKADEVATNDVGWAANLAIFRIVYLYAAILPIVFHLCQWTSETMPLLASSAWQPISFYRWIPDDVVAINGYESVFSTNPDDHEPTSRILIDTFSLQSLEAQAATNDVARSSKAIRMWEQRQRRPWRERRSSFKKGL
jgi:hypothetical protein